MIVVNSNDVKNIQPQDEIVKKGPVSRNLLVDPKDAGGFSVLSVTFGPGAILNFHTHTSEHFLYVTEGKGIVATKEKEYVVTPGCLIYIAPGEVHMHGAAKDSSFTHLAIQKAGAALAE